MPCRDCLHYLSSEDAHQGAFLEGSGYCKAGETPLLRARLFNAARDCWLIPQRYQKEFKP